MRRAAEERSPASVLLALGSNIEPFVYLPRALAELKRIAEVRRWSALYETAAVGGAGAAPFVNAALELLTHESPKSLKYGLVRPLEARLGRRRSSDRNAPRTIDIDIALYDDLQLDDPEGGLVLPDPDIAARSHLAIPLAEVAPDRILPGDGRTLAAVAADLDVAAGVRRLSVSPDLWPAGSR